MCKRIVCLLTILTLLLAGCAARDPAFDLVGRDASKVLEESTLQTTENGKTKIETTALPSAETEAPSSTEETAPSYTETVAPSTEAPTAAPETSPVPTESVDDTLLPGENAAFHKMVGGCDGSLLGAVYNAPFRLGEPAPTVTWNEGEYDRLVIYPRWVGSEVSAWQLSRSQSGELVCGNSPVFSTICGEGDCIAAALDRPEGDSVWMLQINSPDGSAASLELVYNGRYGTPTMEYLTNPNCSNLNVSLPDIEDLSWLEDILGANPLYSFLRAADRANLEPWQAIYDYCEPLSAWDDSAAYTIYHGDMYEGTYFLELGRLRESYDSNEGTIYDRLTAQYETYQKIGNSMGILPPGHKDGEALYVDLKGITVYNPTLLVKSVSVTVNGLSMGTYQLTEGDFCTLIELNVTEQNAYQPVLVEVRVEESRCKSSDAILEVWGSLGGNISGAR